MKAEQQQNVIDRLEKPNGMKAEQQQQNNTNMGVDSGWNRNMEDEGTIIIRSDKSGETMIDREGMSTTQIRYLPSGQFTMKDQKTNTGSYKPMV